MTWLNEPLWSPYLVGAAIGILSWFTLLFSGKSLGCSTSFARSAGMLEGLLRGRKKVLRKPYFQEYKPEVDWQWMLVLGIFIGAGLAVLLSGDFSPALLPDSWQAAFGPGKVLRLAIAMLGGVLVGFGARWADGCTSGHGISGAMQLSTASWVAALAFFAGGIVTAGLLFRILA